MNVLDRIEQAEYVATDEQIEQLAHVAVQGAQAGVVYLRTMLVDVQSRLGKARGRPRARIAADTLTAQDDAINAVHERMYARVLIGVAQGTPDLPAVDRQRRATWARSTTSALRAYVRAGNDLRTIDAATVTKSALQKAVRPAPTGNRTEQRIVKAEETLLGALKTLLKRDEEAALDAMDRIRNALDELEGVEQPTTSEGTRADIGGTTTTHIRRPPGLPMSERAGAQLHRGG